MTSQMNFGPEWMRSNSFSKGKLQDKLNKVENENNFINHNEFFSEDSLSFLNFDKDGNDLDNIFNSNSNYSNVSDIFTKSTSEESIPSWSSVDKNNFGTFDQNGVFCVDTEENLFNEKDIFSAQNLTHTIRPELLHPENLFFNHSNDSQTTMNKFKWYYLDPNQNIQGPFSAIEMQEWYHAGYFNSNLYVRREDGSNYETISQLIHRVRDPKTPFLSSSKDIYSVSVSAHPSLYSENNIILPSFLDNSIHLFNPNNFIFDNLYQTNKVIQPNHSFDILPTIDNMNYSKPHWSINKSIDTKESIDLQQVTTQQQYLEILRQTQQRNLLFQQKILLEHQSTDSNPILQTNLSLESSSTKTEVPDTSDKTELNSPKLTQEEDLVLNGLKNIQINKEEKSSDINKKTTNIIKTEKTNDSIPVTTQKPPLIKDQASLKLSDKIHIRSKTWSTASSTSSVPSKSPSVILSPSRSTHTRSTKQKNACNKPPVRQKHLSMTSAIPPTRSKPVPALESTSTNNKKPSEDFIKWCKLSLRDLNPGVNGDEILQILLSFPIDNSCCEIIQDIIYSNSDSLDGRRFANDFMKRRKEDMEGKKLNIVLPQSTMTTNEFKVVTKKGKKRH